MSIKLNTEYPSQANAPTSEYPSGSFKNKSAPGVDDGTPLEQTWANDMLGARDAILKAAGETANGRPDTADDSQVLDAMRTLFASGADVEGLKKNALVQPSGEAQVSPIPPVAVRAGSVLGFDADGQPIAVPDVATLTVAAAEAKDAAVSTAADRLAVAADAAQVATDAAQVAGDRPVVEAARDEAVEAAREAIAAASATGPVYAFPETYAAAVAALPGYPEGAIIQVLRDENYNGDRVQYEVKSGALVFMVNLDYAVNQIRADLANGEQAGKGAGMVARSAIVFNSVAALRNAPIDKNNSYIVTGFADGVRSSNPVIYSYDPAATGVDNGVTFVLPSAGRPGAFITTARIPSDFFGVSLNAAMDALNGSYVGSQGVAIFVPDGTKITDTVHLVAARNITFGGTISLQNDIDTIFLPATGWSGSSGAVRVLCNNQAVRLGWDLKKNALGTVQIDDCTFEDQGNAATQHSADLFAGFLLQHFGSTSITINRGTVKRSWVKPNGSTGDDIGPNRNTVIEGYAPLGSVPTTIVIRDAYSEGLAPEEDSDHIVFNAGQGTADGYVFDVTIDGGRCKNVQRRAIKIIGGPRRTSGVRILGDHHYEGSGPLPWNGIDISGNITVTGSGSMSFKGWLLGLNLWSGSRFEYDGIIRSASVWEDATVSGTFTRAVSVVGGAVAKISSVVSIGHGESVRVSTEGDLEVNVLENDTPHRTLSVSDQTASLKIGRLISKISEGGSPNNNSVNILGQAEIGWIEILNNSGSALATAIRALSADSVSISGGAIYGEFGNTPINIENCTKFRINFISGDDKTSPRLVFVNGGNGILVANCTHPNAVVNTSGSNPPVNFHEFGNAAF